MECRDVYHFLCAYSDGELDPEKAKFVEEHLRWCPICARELGCQQAVKLLVQKQFLNITAPDYLKRRVILELGRAEEYRESGIQVLDLVRWGTHAAQLYNSKNELAEVLVPYMEKGLEQNELCVWVTSEMSEAEARDALAENIQAIEGYIDRGQLQLFSYEDWYLPGGNFDMQYVLSGAAKKYQEALSSGYSGLRITGNVSWLDRSDWDSFMEYENVVNSNVQNYKVLLVCVYKESKCTTDNIVDVMNTHKYVISKTDDLWRLRRSARIE
jgi:mycothiol system anti-sigma-R factor